MNNDVKSKKDLICLKGHVCKEYSYNQPVEGFVNSEKFKKDKTIAFVMALVSLSLGMLLPLIVGYCLSINDLGTDYFEVVFISNAITSMGFCLPFSLLLILGALPLYKRLVERAFIKNGFVKKQAAVKQGKKVA